MGGEINKITEIKVKVVEQVVGILIKGCNLFLNFQLSIIFVSASREFGLTTFYMNSNFEIDSFILKIIYSMDLCWCDISDLD